MLGAMAALYLLTFTAWAVGWHALALLHPTCVAGWEASRGPWGGALSAFLFSVETQQTIGYGYRSPRACAASAALVTGQVVFGQLLTATCAGLVFARLVSPRRRARSIFVSETACLARRNGALTLSFRVGDASAAPSTRGGLPPPPVVTAHLFTWSAAGAAGTPAAALTPSSSPLGDPIMGTAEGERFGWDVEELALEGGGRLPPLVLPARVEHVIDAASPLAGHTPASLARAGAEIVVQVIGTSDRGERWCATRSFLGTELAWGCGEAQGFGGGLVTRALPGQGPHRVDYARFHEVARLPGAPTADAVLAGPPARGAVPVRGRPGRSLVLSDRLVVGPLGAGGSPALAVRLGDTRGTALRLRARFSFRRGTATLDLAVDAGAGARPVLGAPGLATLGHTLSASSPLCGPDPAALAALAADGDAVIDVCVDGWDLARVRPVRVCRSYALGSDLAAGFGFAPALVLVEGEGVGSPKPRPRPHPVWSAFHEVVPAAAGPWAAGASPASVVALVDEGEAAAAAAVAGGPGAAGRV
jgi:hypothetical protein